MRIKIKNGWSAFKQTTCIIRCFANSLFMYICILHTSVSKWDILYKKAINKWFAGYLVFSSKALWDKIGSGCTGSPLPSSGSISPFSVFLCYKVALKCNNVFDVHDVSFSVRTYDFLERPISVL